MHVYDADKISGGLTVETLSENIDFKALNDKEYVLESGNIIIRDEREIHCVAGIIGGANSSCSENTTRVILEAASFNSEYIAKAGRKLQINTDSRYRFERNVNSEFTLSALDLATDLILFICGGSASKVISTGNAKLPVRTLDFSTDFLKSRANVDIDEKEISDILTKLGFGCNVDDETINITIPSWRYDVSIKEDIVEEIVRIHGYDNLPETPLPVVDTSRIIPKDRKLISDTKRLLASSGYTEIVTWSFMDSEKAKLFSDLIDELRLQNPISSDLNYMRPSILPNLLKVAGSNINRSFHDLSLFEAGPIFKNAGDQVINYVCAVRTGSTSSKNSHGDFRKFDVFDMKADIAILLESVGLDINKCQIKNNAPEYYHSTRSASLSLGKNVLGYFGQVHTSILKSFEIDIDVMAFELNISNFPYGKGNFGKRPNYTVSDYQKITRDYAFIVDSNQPVGEILNLIRNADKKISKSCRNF
jgi:phenylalanyl-tRNA synthetase beta chain